MAKSTPQSVIQTILLHYVETTEGVGKAIKAIARLRKTIDQNEQAAKKYKKTGEAVSKMTFGMGRAVGQLVEKY
ncbi:unnamed protein product, partial [marine sediment metagenome]